MDVKKELDAIILASTQELNDRVEQELTKDKLNYTLFQLKVNINELTECVNKLTDAVEKMKEAS
tara:strand:- start:648 stop:839 length:192 start_codon:yes stop_codon:yes gene_type:complete